MTHVSEIVRNQDFLEDASDFESENNSVKNQSVTSRLGADRIRSKRFVVNRRNGPFKSEIFVKGLDKTVMVDDGGYIDKTLQLSILQNSGRQLDEYYRRMFPSVYLQQGEADQCQSELQPYGMDEMDALDLQRDLDRRLKKQEEEYKSKLAEQAAEIEKLKAEKAPAEGAGVGSSGS